MPVSQDQGDQLELSRTQTQDGAQGADSPGTADRPARGSAADLRHRLERLPQGHPSSPYHDDGTPKPPLAQLKNLELPLPGEERAPNGGVRRDASAPRVATPRANDRAADHGLPWPNLGIVKSEQPRMALEEVLNLCFSGALEQLVKLVGRSTGIIETLRSTCVQRLAGHEPSSVVIG